MTFYWSESHAKIIAFTFFKLKINIPYSFLKNNQIQVEFERNELLINSI